MLDGYLVDIQNGMKDIRYDIETVELLDARLPVCEVKERSAVDRAKVTYGEKYDPMITRKQTERSKYAS